jgi:hypothetical protein
MIDELKSELDRTGLTLRKLALHIAETDRSKLSPETLNSMLAECPLHSITDHSADLVDILRSHPDTPAPCDNRRAKRDTTRRSVISAEMSAQLDHELTRTAASVSVLARRLFSNMDASKVAQSIYLVRKGILTTLPANIWSPLIEHLQSLPSPGSTFPISESSGEMVLPTAESYPKKAMRLSSVDDSAAAPDLELAQILPSAPRPHMIGYSLSDRLKRAGYVVIDEQLYQALHDQRRRTLVSPRRLLAAADKAPAGLKTHLVKGWFSGQTRCAEGHYLEWVFDRYRSLPSVSKK